MSRPLTLREMRMVVLAGRGWSVRRIAELYDESTVWVQALLWRTRRRERNDENEIARRCRHHLRCAGGIRGAWREDRAEDAAAARAEADAETTGGSAGGAQEHDAVLG